MTIFSFFAPVTPAARLLVMFLAFSQPLVRGWARYFTWLQFKRTPRAVIATRESLPPGTASAGTLRRRSYWSEEGKDRHHLLTSTLALLEEEGWRYSTDTGWKDWDVQIYGNFWWSIELQTVTEYHGGPKCLTRVGLRNRFVTTTVIINLVILSLLIYGQLNASEPQLWVLVGYVAFVAFLANRARRLKRRVADLVDVAAHRVGLQPIQRARASAAEPVQPAVATAKTG